uniref:Uncharacterized protein n=1 Tax=Anguilla anguilla TaxID=7936 RepID=A0A0E9TBI1_ANGAN
MMMMNIFLFSKVIIA